MFHTWDILRDQVLEAQRVGVAIGEKKGKYLLKEERAAWSIFFSGSLNLGWPQMIVQNGQLIFTRPLVFFPRHPMFKMSWTPGSFHSLQNVLSCVLHSPPLPYNNGGQWILYQDKHVHTNVIVTTSQPFWTAKWLHLIQTSRSVRLA